MNKNDLVGVVAEKAGVPKSQAAAAVDAVFDAVTDSLKKPGTKFVSSASAPSP